MIKGSKKENGKTKRIYLRTTEEEYKKILENANQKKMTMSKYILDLVEKDKIKK